jgi:plastocyanin
MARTYNIEIVKKAYPDDTKVAKGDTVVWTNRMNMNHTVTADNGEFDSGPFGKDKSFSQVFNTAGAFAYHCEIHEEMVGKVTVT